MKRLALILSASVAATTVVFAQQAPKLPAVMTEPRTEPVTPSPIEKLGGSNYRIGEMLLDTKRKALTVPGTVNDVTIIEFIANTKGGFKAYESALTLNTSAVSFNAALLLMGLDPARSRPAGMQFDKNPPEGDPVEIRVAWQEGKRTRQIDVEELLYDQRSKKTLPKGPWVYTGSTFFKLADGSQRYQAEVDGVLIGFMHGPQSVIDNPRSDALDGFGFIVVNPELKLAAETPITMTITALPLKK